MKIIMVCTGNTCRSPLAQALALKKMAADPFFAKDQIASAGLAAFSGDSASAGSLKVAENHGLSLEKHRSQALTPYHLEAADQVLTMTRDQAEALQVRYPEFAEKIRPLAKEDILDPYGGDDAIYEACYQVLDKAIEDYMKERKSEEDVS